MKDNKNIERLFQEKFKDFEALPPQDSWNIIANRLNEKKKKKRIVPIWFQFSGVAASLLLISSLIWDFSGESNTTEMPNSVKTVVNTKDIKNDSNNSNIALPNNEAIVYDSKSNNEDSEKIKKKLFDEKIVSPKLKDNSSSKNGVVSNDKLRNGVNTSLNQIETNKIGEKPSVKGNYKNDLVVNSQKNQRNEKSNSKLKENNSAFENPIENNIVTKNNREDKPSISKEKIDVLLNNKTSNTIVNNDNYFTKNKAENSNVVVFNEIMSKDSTLITEVSKEPNPLEELLEAKEAGKNEDEKEEKKSKWAISTNASPVYFNSLAEGSSIDKQFDSNSKNFTTTLSYGLAGIYSINKKLSLKTGVNNINLSYNTNDVVFDARISATESNIPSISRNADATNMIFSSKNNSVNAFLGDVENVTLENNVGALKQNISYIEVPLELSYKLLDKKFGIEVIGGMSTLFLNQNNISLVTNGLEMEVGRANNLNNIHFSSNVGLGFKYSFWKSFNANFQPMFKYQINTFSENSSNFKPYFIGLYTGVSFSF